jgi:hypothetical protein
MMYFRDDVIQFQIKETATINCKMCPLKHQRVDATVGGILDPEIIMHPVFRTFLLFKDMGPYFRNCPKIYPRIYLRKLFRIILGTTYDMSETSYRSSPRIFPARMS